MLPAQRKAIEERLERIRLRNNGVLTPEAVVADAASKSSPLHSEFEWNDKRAAHQYRLDQARELIRKVTVEIRTTTRTVCVPRYVRDQTVDPRDQGYAPVAEVKDEISVARETLAYEFRRAVSLLERTADIASVIGLDDEFADLLGQADVLQKKIESVKPARAKRAG